MNNEGLGTEEIIPELFADLLTKVRDGLSQWYGFWTGFNAILSVTTIRNTTFLHQHVESFIAEVFPGGMHVEQTCLVHSRSPKKVIVL